MTGSIKVKQSGNVLKLFCGALVGVHSESAVEGPWGHAEAVRHLPEPPPASLQHLWSRDLLWHLGVHQWTLPTTVLHSLFVIFYILHIHRNVIRCTVWSWILSFHPLVSLTPVWTLWRQTGHHSAQIHGSHLCWWTSLPGGPSFRRSRTLWTTRQRSSSSQTSQVRGLPLSLIVFHWE